MRLALLLLLLTCRPAAADDLKFATWNLDWLTARPAGDPALPEDVRPHDAEGIERLRRYAELLAADVVALQEVDGPAIAARLFPPARYSLHFTGDAVVQRVGFAIRRDIAFRANPDLASLGPGRLRSGADVTLDLPGGRLRLLAVHLKAGCRDDRLSGRMSSACATLLGQARPLQDWIAARRREGMPFLLMGDFNRWMEHGDPFWAALERAAPLLRATTGMSSPCWGGGGFIDHLIAGGTARDWMVAGSLRVLVYRERGAAWKDRLSDHCPVSVLLSTPG
jgi:endonuclease/exonuclease/phosphatase family metal-dependent hydrolase